MLPRTDVQLNPYIPPPQQRVSAYTTPGEQRVQSNTTHHKQEVPPTTTLGRITNAPPIMNAPNPTARRVLKLTKRTHSRRTWANIPNSVPAIMLNLPRRVIPHIEPAATAEPTPPTPRRSKRLHRLPRVRFVPIEGGVRHSNLILQEAINFLTDCVWNNSPDIYTPTKLKSTTASSCLDLQQIALPMMHPTTGERISSYKRLMHNPVTAET
jgi:hypothetical protein